jgi:hypothetical protein
VGLFCMLLQSCGFIFYVVTELRAYCLCCDRTVGLFFML